MSQAEFLDPLAAVFARVRLTARVFQAGTFCGVANMQLEAGVGHLHVLRTGHVTIEASLGSPIALDAPAAVLFARPRSHRLSARGEVDLVCAHIVLGGPANPLERGLPDILKFDLKEDHALAGVLGLLFSEANFHGSARQAVLDRLAEVAIIYLLRRTLRDAAHGAGLLAGLAHPTLSRVLTHMHEQPAQDWTLERMADMAGLSRSTFAELFKSTLGSAPGEYIQSWRLQLARSGLEQGRSLKQVAREVGYTNHAALSRALKRQFGGAARFIACGGVKDL